ncbi:MAG: hypothetical protein IJW46_06750 [Clostridia bacterium]|nr:hypothetical protein [Clostridia bacterium]
MRDRYIGRDFINAGTPKNALSEKPTIRPKIATEAKNKKNCRDRFRIDFCVLTIAKPLLIRDFIVMGSQKSSFCEKDDLIQSEITAGK